MKIDPLCRSLVKIKVVYLISETRCTTYCTRQYMGKVA